MPHGLCRMGLFLLAALLATLFRKTRRCFGWGGGVWTPTSCALVCLLRSRVCSVSGGGWGGGGEQVGGATSLALVCTSILQEMILRYDTLATCIFLYVMFSHRENLMKDLAKMADKRWWRWEKEALVGKRSGITLKKTTFEMQNSYRSKNKRPRPLAISSESWCCKRNGKFENAAKRLFFERSLMEQCANLSGSLLAPVPFFWCLWNNAARRLCIGYKL